MEIGTHLRKLRDYLRLSSRYVAERTGVSHSSYLDWEHDKSSPSLKNYLKLSEAFGVDPAQLILYITGKISETEGCIVGEIIELRELIDHYQRQLYHLQVERKKMELELITFREERDLICAIDGVDKGRISNAIYLNKKVLEID